MLSLPCRKVHTMKKVNLILMLSCCWLPVMAQNWTGAVDSDWNNAANWSAAPANGGDVVINPANYTGAMASPVLTNASAFNPNKVEVLNGGELLLQATLYANNMVSVIGIGSSLRIDSPGFLVMTSSGLAGQLLVRNGAMLEINSGNFTTAGTLIVDQGGVFTSNSGVISLSEGLRLSDGNAGGSSRFYQNGGVCLIDGDLTFMNTIGAYTPLFSQSGGTLEINGSMSWDGAGAGSGRGYFEATGGQITVQGSVQSEPGSTINMDIDLNGPVFFHMEGNTITTYNNDSIVMNGGASWIDENSVTWTNGGVFYANESFYISGNSTINGTGYFQYANLSIPSGKQFVHSTTNAPLRINGDFTINGTLFSGSDRKIIMNGTTTQLLGGMAALTPTFYHFEVNNSGSGVILETMIAITNNFELTDGVITGSQSNAIQLFNSSQIIGGSAQSFVDGYMFKTGNHAFTFPLGAAPDRYRPLTITAPANLSTIVGASYIYDSYPQLTPVELPMLAISAMEYWDLSRTGSSSDFSVSVAWDDASTSGLSDCDAITMAVWNGSEWKFVSSETTGLCSGNNPGTLGSITDLNTIGPLAIGLLEEPVGVDEVAGADINVYPNPLSVDGVLHIHSADQITQVTMYAQDGRQVLSGTPETAANGDQILHLEQVEQGFYHMELTTKSGKKYTRKVEKTFVF